MAEGDAKRWFKIGCFSCLGCLGLCVVIVALFVGAAWIRARSEKVEERVLTHATPPSSLPPAPPAPPKAPAEGGTIEEPTSKAAGTVVLNLSGAEFHLEPGTPGTPIRVEASYDRASYSLEESSEEAKDGAWTYQVVFRRTTASSWMVDALSGIFSGTKPSLRIYLPPDVPLALEMEIERGGMEAEIGGLHLTSGKVHVSMAGLQLKVSEPLAEPMERLEVKSEMGGAEFRSLGNASPRVLDVSFSMGGMQLDLGGSWRADSDISIQGSMGGGEVRLPKHVRIEGVKGRGFEAPQEGELKVPTLRFKSSSGMKNVEFR